MRASAYDRSSESDVGNGVPVETGVEALGAVPVASDDCGRGNWDGSYVYRIDVATLPYSIRVLLEACLRNVDGFVVDEKDVPGFRFDVHATPRTGAAPGREKWKRAP